MAKKILSLLMFLALSTFVQAEDKAIIVFDASGSMWGQLEGKTKIAIAKKTLADVVTNWNEEKQLGLLAYGHRRKGDCKDIETLVPVGKINKSAMIAKVNKINPKGKTPISASIKMAADELKFTEDNATVILISDGKETCKADPCETAAELEKLGVNFTAHVIGFGVDKQTSEQLQCIAANTGGLYFPANNAEQLNDALKQVVEKAKVITIRGMDEKNGGILHKMIDWKLINQESEEVISLNGSGAGVSITVAGEDKNDKASDETITRGTWIVSGTSGKYAGEASVEITGDEDQLITVNMMKQLPKVIIKAANEAVTGTALNVTWEVPKDLKGLINLQLADEKPKYHASPLFHTNNKKAATMRLPSVAGNYLLRFYDSDDRKEPLAEHPIKLSPAEIVINAPDEAGTGTEIELSWESPNDIQAKLNLELAEDKPKYHRNPTITINDKKKQATMRMVATPGDYVLRWYNRSDSKLVAEKPIKIIEEPIVITAPDEAGTGTEIDISWEAPKTVQAKLTLELAEDKPKYHSSPSLTIRPKSNSGTMRMPANPGDYVLRWYNRSDSKLITEKPIKLIEEPIVITAPDEAGTGTEIDISWEAPKSVQAKLTLELAEDKPKYHSNPALTIRPKSNTGTMRMPSKAGDYRLRWYNRSDSKLVTEKPIKLIEETIVITAPDEAGIGTEIDIAWEAPKTVQAKLTLELAEDKPKYHSNPALTIRPKSSSGTMRLPAKTGDYMLRWYNRSDSQLVTEKPIKLIEEPIIINAPDKALTGTEIDVSWEAPKTSQAVVNLQLADEKPNYNSRPYIYTKDKQSGILRLPATAGDYMLRWYNQSDQKIMVERPLKIEKAEIKITAAGEALAGTELDLSWDAPKSSEAVINLQLAGEKPNYNSRPYLYTKNKNQSTLRLPSVAGDYMLRWFNQSDQKVVTEQPFKVTPIDISITTEDQAIAGTELDLSWEAPRGLDGFINVELAGKKPNYNARNYLYTKGKTSGNLRLPSVPGEYTLRWFNKNDKTPLAERPITLTAPEINISVPDNITADSEIEISWEAPKGLNNSFINIQKEGEKPNYNAKKYLYTRENRSGYMKMPAEPGAYVLRWYNQSVQTPIKEKKITINPKE